LNNSARFTRNLYSFNKTGQFFTNFVDVADDGILSFAYRAVNYTSYPTVPTPATSFEFAVLISTDFGISFTPIYVCDATTHTASTQYAFVEVDLSAYSGETAMFVISAAHIADDFYLDFDDFSVSFVEPGLEFLSAEVLMGERPIGAWMKPAALGIMNNPGKGSFTFNTVDLDNNYDGFLSAVSPALPFVLEEGELTEEFGIRTNNTEVVPGAYSGSLAFFYLPTSTRAVAVVPFSGSAYTPVNGDVWEKAFTASTVAFPVTVAKGDFRDNYDLPGTAADGWDVVYKIVVSANDVLANISLSGTDAKMAVYPANFGGVGGPDTDNALASATTSVTGLELYKATYYLVVSTTGPNYTLNYTTTVMPSPVAVTNLTPVDGAVNIINGSNLTWSWGANTMDYRVVLGTTYPPATVVQDWTTANTATDGSYTLSGLNPNLQYFWRVDTRNNNGTTNGEVWGFTTTITPPSALAVTVNDPGESATTVSASLTWTGPTNRAFIGYNVYRGGVKITPTPINNASFTDLGLARNASYSYYVTNVYDEGESAASNTVSITTLGVGNVNGTVYDVLTTTPLEGASVRIQGANGTYTFTTNAAGAYSGQVYAGLYNYTVSATDFDSQTLTGQTVLHNGTLTKDFYLSESPYPVADVVAFELDEDKVQVSWGGSTPPPPPPLIEEWLAHDNNGVPTQYWWAGAGAPFSWAINFEPADLVDLDGASLTKIAIFNTNAPDVNILNIYSGNLSTGAATLVHTQAIGGLVLQAWNEVDLTVPVPIDVTKQLWVSMYSASPTAGTAASTPLLNMKGDWINFSGSWIHMSTGTGNNVTWSLRAFATNASNRSVTQLVSKYKEPRYNTTTASTQLQSTLIENAKPFRPVYSDRGIADYTVWREKVYQAGTLEEIGNTSQLDFVDFDWGTMDWGVYRWAVTANYDGGQSSIPTYSNVLDKDMEVMVDVAVSLNSNESPGGTSVTFTNMSEPDLELVYNTVLGSTGTFEWDGFRRGVYDIQVMLPGYAVVQEMGVEIFDDASFTWLLEELLSSPSNLYVTPTAFATWDLGGGGGGGAFTPFLESFDGLANGELPAGWTNSPVTTNWGASNTNYAGGTAPEMRFYWSPSGIGDYYLMTPVMSTEGQSTLQLSFKHEVDDYSLGDPYILRVIAIADGVEYIIHEWNDPDDVPAITETFTLTSAHGVGAADFRIAWVYSGDSFDINEWDIDDVMLNGSRANAGNRAYENSKVFLDGQLVAETPDREYQFDVATLTPYETYTAGVAAVYATGQSPTVEFDFIYVPCDDYDAPTAFAAAQVEGTLDVMLEWTNVDAAALDTISALRIYRDGEQTAQLNFETAVVDSYVDADLDFGTYTYCITYIYESGAESCQGVVCETAEVTGGGFATGNVSQAAYLGGDPIEGAMVTLTSTTDNTITFSYATDADGDYEGEVLGNQTYDYVVEAAGYVTQTLSGIEILLIETVVQDFLMMEFPAP
ncbi:MAG: carboxypeptidase regulatory-like domain-containing protein, partial [Bacteroidales bacterium]|nr:carboxypeptidase regulatory-like domain-containing protein [Bacteroidales bacterium]